MSIICKDNEMSIRNLENTNYDMNCILKWLNNKNVSDYYGDSRKYTLEEVQNKYVKKIESNSETPCILEYSNTPIGYILIDPKTTNKRAIECYRKCGFKDICVIPKREEKDGIKYDNLIMKIENYKLL